MTFYHAFSFSSLSSFSFWACAAFSAAETFVDLVLRNFSFFLSFAPIFGAPADGLSFVIFFLLGPSQLPALVQT